MAFLLKSLHELRSDEAIASDNDDLHDALRLPTAPARSREWRMAAKREEVLVVSLDYRPSSLETTSRFQHVEAPQYAGCAFAGSLVLTMPLRCQLASS
jgi:hypothetical protein